MQLTQIGQPFHCKCTWGTSMDCDAHYIQGGGVHRFHLKSRLGVCDGVQVVGTLDQAWRVADALKMYVKEDERSYSE